MDEYKRRIIGQFHQGPVAMWYPGDSNEEVETGEEEDGQRKWLLPRGANPAVNGKRCTCGVAIAVKDSDTAMHSSWCDLKGGDDAK